MRSLLIILGLLVAAPLRAVEIPAIAYHDIVDRRNGDPYAITRKDFERQMDYLARQGFTPISLKHLDDAKAGRATLPSKPVLLTFDDGLRSYYTHAFPILERHRFPSILSVVTAWIDRRSMPDGYRTAFLDWDELRTLVRSPLVEVISHSDDLHHGLPGNPWGSLLPAGTVRVYEANARYETEARHRQRVREDLRRSVARLQDELSVAPAGIAWPYGQYDGVLVAEATALGMPYHLTLEIGPNRLDSLPQINRITFRRYRGLYDLGDALAFKAHRRQQLRFVQIDLGVFAGKHPTEQKRLVARLIERLQLLRTNSVILRPFTADGSKAFFPNEALPMESDLLSYVIHQIVSRTEAFEVYLRLPAGRERLSAGFFVDLGRLCRFSGLILESAGAADIAAIRSALVPYKPNLKLAVTATKPIPGADYLIAEVDRRLGPRDVARLASEHLGRGETLFLVETGDVGSEAVLRAQMQALRAAGVRHYGYGPDDFLGRLPDARQIVIPLREHTIMAESR